MESAPLGERGVFRGVSTLSVDDKGRIAIPKKYRDDLLESFGSQLIVTIDTDRCLLLYPLPAWREIETQLTALSAFNKVTRSLQRLYVGHATGVEMDGQGRLLLPAELRQFASLNGRVVLVGQGKKFEIWDEETWNRQRDVWLDVADLENAELPPELQGFSL